MPVHYWDSSGVVVFCFFVFWKIYLTIFSSQALSSSLLYLGLHARKAESLWRSVVTGEHLPIFNFACILWSLHENLGKQCLMLLIHELQLDLDKVICSSHHFSFGRWVLNLFILGVIWFWVWFPFVFATILPEFFVTTILCVLYTYI